MRPSAHLCRVAAAAAFGLATLAGCSVIGGSASQAGMPSSTPVLGGGANLAGPTLPPSWTPGPTLTSPAITPNATTTATLTPSPFPSPTIAPGWTKYAVLEDGYALYLPPTWLPLPLEGQDPVTALAYLEKEEEALVQSVSHGLPIDMLRNLSFVAFDSGAALQDAPFVSTLRAGRATLNDIDKAVSARSDALDADPASTLLADWPLSVGFEARRGWLLRYTSQFPPDAPLATIYHTQVYTESGSGQVVIFTFSTVEAKRDGYERLFELVLETVHFPTSEAP